MSTCVFIQLSYSINDENDKLIPTFAIRLKMEYKGSKLDLSNIDFTCKLDPIYDFWKSATIQDTLSEYIAHTMHTLQSDSFSCFTLIVNQLFSYIVKFFWHLWLGYLLQCRNKTFTGKKTETFHLCDPAFWPWNLFACMFVQLWERLPYNAITTCSPVYRYRIWALYH